MTLNCHDLEGLIDLYAAGELPPGEQHAARAHLLGCPSCRRQLDEARALLGLLDVHYAQAGGLARLRRAVRREAGGRRLLRLAEKLAPLAALLLVAAGLLLLVPARRASPELAVLPAELALAPASAAPAEAKPSRGSRNGREKASLRKGDFEEAGPRRALAGGLRLTLDNPTDRPLVVDLGAATLRVDVRGRGVERRRAPAGAPRAVPRRQVTVPAHGRYAVELGGLASQDGAEVHDYFASGKGPIVVTAALTAPSWPAGEPARRRDRTWKAGPATLPLAPR